MAEKERSKLKIISLGGLNQIGKNITVFEYDLLSPFHPPFPLSHPAFPKQDLQLLPLRGILRYIVGSLHWQHRGCESNHHYTVQNKMKYVDEYRYVFTVNKAHSRCNG